MSKSIEKISIIIPAYNQEKYIERCIQSAINQTQPALEIIVVNDGSTDNTLKIIDGYEDKIRIISKKNGGVSSARNKAIENAVGDWILLLDSDDELFPEHIEYVMPRLKESNCQFTYVNSIVEKDGVIVRTGVEDEQHEVRDLLSIYKSPYTAVSGIVIARQLLRDIGGFDTSLNTAEDIDVKLKLMGHTNILHIHKNLIKIQWRNDSLSRRLDTYKDELYVYQQFNKNEVGFCKENKKTVNEVRARSYRQWGDVYLFRGANIQAIKKFAISLYISFEIKTLLLLIKACIPNILKDHYKKNNSVVTNVIIKTKND